METSEVISIAFAMGLVGSLHCIGMCGPIAMTFPIGNRSLIGRLSGGVVYNLGRIFTYTALGLLIGFMGDFFITPKIQSTVSISFGVIILLSIFLPKALKKRVSVTAPVRGFFLTLRNRLGRLLSLGTNRSLFAIGLLNGLLPCGMIYLALTSSFITGSAVKGGLFMAAFGLGTFPAMLAVVFFGSYFTQKIRINFRKAIPVFLACMATLLVLRGLNLGIPYISPLYPSDVTKVAVPCH